MRSVFVTELEALIHWKFTSRRAFIRAARPPSEEESEQAYLGQVMAGKKPPPMDRLESWADALKLSGDPRQRFFDLACIAHLPREYQARFVAFIDGESEQSEQALVDSTLSTAATLRARIGRSLAGSVRENEVAPEPEGKKRKRPKRGA